MNGSELLRPSALALVCALAGTANAQSLIGCTPPTGLPASDYVCLDDYATNTDLLWRSIGLVNFSDSLGTDFVPFPTGGPVDPYSGLYADLEFRSYYGDRLGYEANGLFDVNGDGFNDWTTTWYDARPIDGLTNSPRVPVDAYVMPAHTDFLGNTYFAHSAADLASRTTWNKVGMLRVFSGKDNSQIGQEMWSHRNNAIAPHELGPLRDIDGDGRDELVVAANTFNGTRGGVYVMSYTNKYNAPGDTTERWVCIMHIAGVNSQSEFAYELEDTQSDFNGDGQNDIVAASTFWRVAGGREGNKTGAGWIFLTPPQQFFIDVQKSTTWPTDPLRDNVKRPLELIAEVDYNLCVMQLDDTTGMPIDPHNNIPPNADDLRVGSIGDLADAGDLDGDGHTDFSVFGFYRYDDNGKEVTTGAVYFMLSSDGFGSTGYTLHDKQSRIIGLDQDKNGDDIPMLDPNYVGVAVDIYQDAEVVFHGDDERSYSNNLRSYFRHTLDDSGGTDMALISYKGTNFGRVDVYLDGQTTPRFYPTGSIGSLIPPAGPMRPLAYSFDDLYNDLTVAPEYSFGGGSVYATDGTPLSLGNINGLNFVGDYDGDGDTELSISTIKGYKLGTGNPNYSLIGTASVIDIPNAGGDPTVLQSIQHETPIYHSINNPLTGLSYGGSGMHRRGFGASAAWDQDKDGRDDLLLKASSTAQQVHYAPDPFGSNTPVQIFDPSNPIYDGYRPYQTTENPGAGSTHILLSPPSEPELVTGRSLYSAEPGGTSEIHISLTVDKISPEIDPATFTTDGNTFARDFDQNEFVIELVATEQGAACRTAVVQALPSTAAGAVAPRRFSFKFPVDGCSSSPAGMLLRIRSRWINDDPLDPGYGQPWITPVPPARGFGTFTPGG